MNSQLASAAIAGIKDPTTESRPGYCSRWVRQVVTGEFPGIYDALFGTDANETGENFLRAGLAQRFAVAGTIEEGDILIKEFAPHGHIGIAVRQTPSGSLFVAENSSTHVGRVLGAKGYRPLISWGQVAIVARIPSISPKTPAGYSLWLAHKTGVSTPIGAMPLMSGMSYAPLRAVCQALGLDLDIDEQTRQPIIGGAEFGIQVTIVEGSGYVPVRALAAFLGLVVAVDETTRAVTLSRP